MIVPAIVYKDEIEKWSDLHRYSESMFLYNGSPQQARINVLTDDTEGRYQWAIIDRDAKLVGYISYNIDYFSSCAYSFGLVAFTDDHRSLALGILSAIKHLKHLNLHRIEWRCISDNPAKAKYLKIIEQLHRKYNQLTLHEYIKDESGKYHDMDIFEIFMEELNG